MCGCNHQTGYVCYRHRDSYRDPLPAYPEPLAEWEKELLGGRRPEGEGDVTFTRLDGRKVVVKNVRVDSIGTDGAEPLFNIAVEKFDDGEIIHVPFVQTWVIDY